MTIIDHTTTDALATYITTELSPTVSPTELYPDSLLIESGIIDSLKLFKLISFVEEHFDVMIEPDEIVLENFETLASIQNLLLTKRS